jgi:hypothetical protein
MSGYGPPGTGDPAGGYDQVTVAREQLEAWESIEARLYLALCTYPMGPLLREHMYTIYKQVARAAGVLPRPLRPLPPREGDKL